MTPYDPTPLEKLRILFFAEKDDSIRLWDTIYPQVQSGEITQEWAFKEALNGSFMLGAIAYREYARKNGFDSDRYEGRDIEALQRRQALILMRSTN